MIAFAKTDGRRLRVAHVVLSLDVGGLERMVLDLVRQGRQIGQRPVIVCLEHPGALAPEAIAAGAHLVTLQKPPGVRPSLAARLHTVFQKLRPDVVHTHQIAALLYAGPAARAAGVRAVVHTEHGKNYSVRRRTQWAGRIAGACAHRFFCVSEDIVDEVRQLRVAASGKLRFLPNGIDPAPFAAEFDAAALRRRIGLSPDDRVIGTVGRLTEIKCQDILLRGFASVAPRDPAMRLLIVGDGPRRAELEALADSLGIGARVHFAGYQARPQDYLRAMNVFALTSRSEGMPLCVLEAWAAGVPIVATRVGSLPRLVEHERTGLLIPPFDAAALAASLLRLFGDSSLRCRLRDAGLDEVFQTYQLAAMAQRYDQQYRELLAA